MPPRRPPEPCWNCWQHHPDSSCPEASRGPRQRENLRILLKIPTPSKEYHDLTKRLLTCYNCWSTISHEADDCPRPTISTFDREVLRQRLNFPISPNWQKILGEQGVRTHDVREHIRRGGVIGGSMMKQGSLLPDGDRVNRLDRRLRNWDRRVTAWRYDAGLHEILMDTYGPDGPVSYARELPSPIRPLGSPTRYGSYSGSDSDEEEEDGERKDCYGLGEDAEGEDAEGEDAEVDSDDGNDTKREYTSGEGSDKAEDSEREDPSSDHRPGSKTALKAERMLTNHSKSKKASTTAKERTSSASGQVKPKKTAKEKAASAGQLKESLADILDRRTGLTAYKGNSKKDRSPSITSEYSAEYLSDGEEYPTQIASHQFIRNFSDTTALASNGKHKKKDGSTSATNDPPSINHPSCSNGISLPFGIESAEFKAWAFNQASSVIARDFRSGLYEGDAEPLNKHMSEIAASQRTATTPNIKKESSTTTTTTAASITKTTPQLRHTSTQSKSKYVTSESAVARSGASATEPPSPLSKHNNANSMDLLCDIGEEDTSAVFKPLTPVPKPHAPVLKPTVRPSSTPIKTEEDIPIPTLSNKTKQPLQPLGLIQITEEEEDYELTEEEEAEILEAVLLLRDAIREYRETVPPMMLETVRGLKHLRSLFAEE